MSTAAEQQMIDKAVQAEIAVRRAQEELAWAQQDAKSALLALDPSLAIPFTVALSNALSEGLWSKTSEATGG